MAILLLLLGLFGLIITAAAAAAGNGAKIHVADIDVF